MEAKLLILFAIVALSAGGPISFFESDTCVKSCPSTSQKFNYQLGKTYTYDYSLKTDTTLDGASEDTASLQIKGRADIEVIDQCDFVLKVNSISVYESSPQGMVVSTKNEQFRRTLEKYPLRFAYQDGLVSGLCPDSNEDGWALNVKRGIISGLQNSMDNLQVAQEVQETDVTGRCQTKYEVTNNWRSTNIKRTKDLLGCTDRHDYAGSLQSMTYPSDSSVQSLPLLKSNHECVQEVNRQGVLKVITCTEKHLFRPFSSEGSGASTTVEQKLQFVREIAGVSTQKGPIQSRVELLYDHDQSVGNEQQSRSRAEDLLNKLCDLTVTGIKPEVPRLFSQLVSAIRNMYKADLNDLYGDIKDKTICSSNNERVKKFFLDGLPMAGTSESVDMMKDLLLNGEVSGLTVDFWLTSLSLIKEPTADMLASTKRFLETPQLKQKALLPVSSMVNNFCDDKIDCNSEPAVDDIMDNLEQTIGSCYVTDSTIKNILLTLRAIGNAGQDRSVRTLTSCLHSSLPMEVRIAATQAFRRLSCDADKTRLLDILKDSKEDPEIRVGAYLQLMTCPTSNLLTQIQIVLENEPEKSHVGTFIWTHATNLLESSNPLNQDVKNLLRDVQLKKQYELNPLKFSRNYEKSVFFQLLNTGAQAQSNVIFSSQSSFPRSINAGLTVDLFGHSINLFEVGARLEGLEYLTETVLFPYRLPQNEAKTSKQSTLDELKGSAFARFFGNEMAFNRFQGLGYLTSGKTFNLLDFLIKLSDNHDLSLTQSVQFLDASITIPTVAGLPLTLSVNGTASVDVRAVGKIDLRKVSQSPRSLNIDGEIRPSGAVNIDSMMTVDALLSRSGLKMSSTLHSSLAFKGRMELERGRVLSVQFDMPDDRIDILDIRTKFFVIKNDDHVEQKMITENRREYELCTGPTMERLIGLQLCGQLQFPNASTKATGPFYPLTGPSSLSLVLHKRDKHTGYKLLAKRVENKKSSMAQMSFDTPGSTVVRAMSFDMMVDYEKKEAEFSAASPWKKLSAKGAFVNDDSLKSVSGQVIIDDSDVYATLAEWKIDEKSKDRVVIYSPTFEIRRPGAESISLQGSIEVDDSGKTINTDLSLSGVLKKQPLQFQGNFKNTEDERSLSGTFSKASDQYTARIGVTHEIRDSKKGYVANIKPFIFVSKPDSELVNFSGEADYREDKIFRSEFSLSVPGALDTPISMKCDITKKGRKTGDKYSVDFRIKSKFITTKLESIISNNEDLISSKSTLDVNMPRIWRDRISLNTKYSDKSTQSFSRYTITSDIDFKQNADWNMEMTLDLSSKKRRNEGQLEILYGKSAKTKTSQRILLSTVTEYKYRSLEEMELEYQFKAVVPAVNLNSTLSGKHAHTASSLSSNLALTYDNDKNVKASVSLRDQSQKALNWQGDASLSYPGKNYRVDTTLIEKGGQYNHNLVMKNQDGETITATSSYKSLNRLNHEVNSEINIDGLKPIKVNAALNFAKDGSQLTGQLLHGKYAYGITASNKYTASGQKWLLELAHQTDHLVLSGNLTMRLNDAQLYTELAWDRDNAQTSKIALDITGNYKSSRDMASGNGKVQLTTLLPILSTYHSAELGYTSDNINYGSKLTINSNDKQVVSTFSLAKPISLQNLKMIWSLTSPFNGFQSAGATLEHNIDANSISSTLKASKEQDNAKVSFTGANKSRGNGRDLKAELTFTSTIPDASNFGVSFKHNDNGQKYDTNGVFNYNDQRYEANLDMNHFNRDTQVQCNGQLKVTGPDVDTTATWQHRNTDSDLRTTFTTSWAKGQQIEAELTGKTQFGSKLILNGVSSIKTTFNWPVNQLSINLNNEISSGSIKHSLRVSKGETNSLVETSFDFSNAAGAADVSSSLYLPDFMDSQALGKLKVKYDTTPMTAHAELKLTPRQDYSADASLSFIQPTDFEGSARLRTPYNSIRTVTLQVSNKKERRDIVSKGSLDWGVRKSVEFETRIRPDTFSLARVKLSLPFNDYSKIDAGYQVNGGLNNFDALADISVSPILGKYSGTVNLQTRDQISGKVRIDTPLKDFPYLQITASSQGVGQGRKSQIEAEYYPRQVYRLSNDYSLDMPVTFSAKLETPISGYDTFGIYLNHQNTDTSFQTQGKIQYLPDKVIQIVSSLTWERNIDGSLSVKTPFERFEDNKVSIRHDGTWSDFNSHAEVTMAQKTAAFDAQFKYDYITTGTVILRLPFRDLDKIEAVIRNQGPLDNFKATGTLKYNSKKFEGSMTSRFSARGLKTDVSLYTPYTENIELNLDYKGRKGNTQVFAQGSYGRNYQISSDNSLEYNDPDVIFSSALKYKLGSEQENKASASLNKNGYWENLVLSSTFTSPYTSNVAVSYKQIIQLPYILKTTFTGSYGQDYSIASDTSFDYSHPDITYSTSLKYELAGVMKEVGATLSRRGEMNDIAVEATGNYDDQKLKLSSKFNTQKGLSASMEAETPFSGFENVGMAFTSSGELLDFHESVSLQYMTGKKIEGKVDFSFNDQQDLVLDASLISPIPGLEQTEIKVRHDTDKYAPGCVGSAQITYAQGKHSLQYKRTGDLNKFSVVATAESNGNKIDGSFDRLPLNNGYRHAIQLKHPWGDDISSAAEYEYEDDRFSAKTSGSVGRKSFSAEGSASAIGNVAKLNGQLTSNAFDSFKTAFLTFSKEGEWDDVSMNMQSSIDKKEVNARAAFKTNAQETSGSVSLNTPVKDFTNLGVSFIHNGNWDRFNCEGKVTYKDGKTIDGKSTYYRYNMRRLEITAELNTPFTGLKNTQFEYRHSGSENGFTCSNSFQYSNGQKISTDIRASISPKYDFGVTVKTPFTGYETTTAEYSLESNGNIHNLQSSLDLGNRNRYILSSNVDLDSTPMTFRSKLTTPFAQLSSVEMSGSHQGQLDDFTTSASFNSPPTGLLQADAAFKYDSAFDLSSSGAFRSQMNGFQDLKFEMKNTDNGNGKSSHFGARWATDKQITLDGSYLNRDHWYTSEVQTNLHLTTPFEMVKSASLELGHVQSEKKYNPKLAVTLNGNSVLDVDGAYMYDDQPSASITTRKPWPMQMTASVLSQDQTKGGEVYFNWNRDRVDQNIRVKVSGKHVKDNSQRNVDYSIQITQYSRVLGAGLTLLSTPTTLASQGQIAWDQGEDKKMSYELKFNDDSQRSNKVYGGLVKVGIPTRSFAAVGSYSLIRGVSSLDGSVNWDADRSTEKQLGIVAKIVPGEKTKTDITLRLPAIGKEVHMNSEIALNKGRTLWNGKAEMSYSTDSSKTLTVSSSLTDVTGSYGNGKNYSLALAISHPYTNVDLGFTSTLGATDDKYSAAMDTTYLTANRQRKNLALRGEIDRLRRQIDLQLVSPVKKVAIRGEVKSTDPYVFSLTNTYDDSKVIKSYLTLDPTARSAVWMTNYDLANPNNKLVWKALYVNDSSMAVELYRDQTPSKVTDSLLTVTLSSPTLLSTRLHWRTSSLGDFQDYFAVKLSKYATSTSDTLKLSSNAVGQEVVAKYQAITEEINSEMKPLVDLLDTELARIGEHLLKVQKEVQRMYRQNDFYIRDMGTSVRDATDNVRQLLADLNVQYQQNYVTIIKQLKDALDNLTNFPIGSKYQEATQAAVALAQRKIYTGLSILGQFIINLDDYLSHMNTEVGRTVDYLNSFQPTRYLGDQYQQIRESLTNNLPAFTIPERYTSVINDAGNTIKNGLNQVMFHPEVECVTSAVNEAYQQGVWAYNYFQVEENARKHAAHIAELVKDYVISELDQLTNEIAFLRKSKLTVFDLEQGEIQAEISLPFPLKSLSEAPDFRSYAIGIRDNVGAYLPDRETLLGYYKQYIGVSNNTVPVDNEFRAQLEAFKPSVRRVSTSPRKMVYPRV